MARTVEYCIANADRAARERLRELDCAREKPCLQRCGTCRRGPFLVVDGTPREAPYGETLADLEER